MSALHCLEMFVINAANQNYKKPLFIPRYYTHLPIERYERRHFQILSAIVRVISEPHLSLGLNAQENEVL